MKTLTCIVAFLCSFLVQAQNPISITAHKNGYVQPGLAHIGDEIITPYSNIDNNTITEYSILEFYNYAGQLTDSIAISDSIHPSFKIQAVIPDSSGYFVSGTKGSCINSLELFIGHYNKFTSVYQQYAAVSFNTLSNQLNDFKQLNDSIFAVITDDEVFVSNINKLSLSSLLQITGDVNFLEQLDSLILVTTDFGLLSIDPFNAFAIDTIGNGAYRSITVEPSTQDIYCIKGFSIFRLNKKFQVTDSLSFANTGLYVGAPQRMCIQNGVNYLLDEHRLMEIDTGLQIVNYPYATAYQNKSSSPRSFGVYNGHAIIYGFKDFQFYGNWPKTSLFNILPLSPSVSSPLELDLTDARIDTLYMDTLANNAIDLWFKLSFELENHPASILLDHFTLHVYHGNSICTDPQTTVFFDSVNLAGGVKYTLSSDWVLLKGFTTNDSIALRDFKVIIKATALNSSDFGNINKLNDITDVYSIGMEEHGPVLAQVYPNPFGEYLAIRTEQNLSVSLINAQGQVLLESEIKKGVQVLQMPSRLEAGFYFLLLKDGTRYQVLKLTRFH